MIFQLFTFTGRLLKTYEAIGAALPTLHAPDAAFDSLLDASTAITHAVDELSGCAYDGPDELPTRKKGIVKALKRVGKSLDEIWEKSKENRGDELEKDEDDRVIEGSGPWFAVELVELVRGVVSVQWPSGDTE